VNPSETEKGIVAFVEKLYKSKEYLKTLSYNHDVTLWITLYQDTDQYNLKLSKELLLQRRLKAGQI
jgi:hypothetical protein